MTKNFKVISMGRVGTIAMNRFLNDHPQISLPYFTQTDKIFLKSKGHFQQLPHDKSAGITRKGMVVHDGWLYLKKNRKALKEVKMTESQDVIHLVRNPFEQVISWINHVNASAVSNHLGWQKIKPNVQNFYQNYKEHFITLKVGMQCQHFYQKSSVEIVDFNSLSAKNVKSTMTSLYDFLKGRTKL